MRTRALLLALVLAACAHPHAPEPGGVTSEDAILKITSNVADADLVVDGRVVGRLRVPKGGKTPVARIAVDPGHHQLEIRRDDYFSAYADVQLARAEKKTLVLNLAPILP